MADVTRILQSIEQGNPQASQELLPLVYEELRILAGQRMAHEKPGQTLSATSLVHESRRAGSCLPTLFQSKLEEHERTNRQAGAYPTELPTLFQSKLKEHERTNRLERKPDLVRRVAEYFEQRREDA